MGESHERTIGLAGRQVPAVVLFGLVLAVAAWAAIVAFCEPFGRPFGTGQDAICYWVPSLANPYALSSWTSPIAYPYSPLFLQLLEPIRLLPWQEFMAVWTAALLLAVFYLCGPRLLALGIVVAAMELAGGNIELLLAVAIVLGFRWPATWAFVLLTKVTPGVGLLWFATRREWRHLGLALAATAAAVAGSAVFAPEAWLRWPQVLLDAAGHSGTWAAVPVPLTVRLPIAVVVVVWGARTDRRWSVPVASMLALPALWYGGFSILLATLPLLSARSAGDLWRLVEVHLPDGLPERIAAARSRRADLHAGLD